MGQTMASQSGILGVKAKAWLAHFHQQEGVMGTPCLLHLAQLLPDQIDSPSDLHQASSSKPTMKMAPRAGRLRGSTSALPSPQGIAHGARSKHLNKQIQLPIRAETLRPSFELHSQRRLLGKEDSHFEAPFSSPTNEVLNRARSGKSFTSSCS